MTPHGSAPSRSDVPFEADAMIQPADFLAFIDRGVARLTPRDVHRLVAELPEIRERLQNFDDAGFNHTRGQLSLLADVVESFALQRDEKIPFVAALDAAFALVYFHRLADLIPDSLGALGLLDDATIVSLVLHRHRESFAAAARRLRHNWSTLGIEA